jgi:hypothetical protein
LKKRPLDGPFNFKQSPFIHFKPPPSIVPRPMEVPVPTAGNDNRPLDIILRSRCFFQTENFTIRGLFVPAGAGNTAIKDGSQKP